jgi:hypothetical protein
MGVGRGAGLQWWDIFGLENVETFEYLNYESTSPRCRGQLKLIMDAGGHCGGGDYSYGHGEEGVGDMGRKRV